MKCFIESAGRHRDYNVKAAPENKWATPSAATLAALREFSAQGLVGKRYPACSIVSLGGDEYAFVAANMMLDGFYDEHNRENRMALMVEGLSDKDARALAIAYIENRESFTARFAACIDRETLYEGRLDFGIKQDLSPLVSESIKETSGELQSPAYGEIPEGQSSDVSLLKRKSLGSESGFAVLWAENKLQVTRPKPIGVSVVPQWQVQPTPPGKIKAEIWMSIGILAAVIAVVFLATRGCQRQSSEPPKPSLPQQQVLPKDVEKSGNNSTVSKTSEGSAKTPKAAETSGTPAAPTATETPKPNTPDAPNTNHDAQKPVTY